MGNAQESGLALDRLFHAIRNIFGFFCRIFEELIYGFRARTIPWNECMVVGIAFGILIAKGLDYEIFESLGLAIAYPTKPMSVLLYRIGMITVGFLGWAAIQLALRRRLITRLTSLFVDAGLKSASGRLPGFLFDRPVDSYTRKLRVSRNGLPMERFKGAKSSLEGGMQIYIDDIRENREGGTIDILYSHTPMPSKVVLGDLDSIPRNTFFVGNNRSNPIQASFRDVPHLLIAGQTGGGKSTFLRQFITTLYLRNPSYRFTLIDLKAGLEFQLFEGMKRIAVVPSVEEAVDLLSEMKALLEQRMEILREDGSKDIETYQQKRRTSGQNLSRHIIVVDEAAELFLAGHHASAEQVKKARSTLSQIARQGRSAGIHLVVATQRPDVRSLDPQVKANLPGVLCFQMANLASSMTVLGNGRAAELPPTPGRAIWKAGRDVVELQTPFLSPGKAESLLHGSDSEDADAITKGGKQEDGGEQ